MRSFILLCCSILLTSLYSAAQPPTAAPPFNVLGWQAETHGAFVMALCTDTRGGIWIGTEDKGVWRYDAATRRWQNWTTADGLGDNDIYALACDTRGRVWAGHLNHGVSVWNGAAWKNYDVLSGPLGERVFDIAVCPTDGDVWMATNAGLSRYHDNQQWLYYHRGTGLPADQISALAFDAQGALFAGTHCDGLAIASPENNYATWRRVTSPFPKFPYAAVGRGLPSNIINDVLVMKNGMIVVATRTGLARSEDGGQSWMFIRGANWQMRMDGVYENPHLPIVEARPINFPGPILIEDAVNCLAEDAQGLLWVGYDNKGCQARNAKTNELLYDASNETPRDPNGDCIRAILPFPGARPTALYGRYGGIVGGLSRTGKIEPVAPDDAAPVVPFPVPAAPLNETALNELQKELENFTAILQPGEGIYLGSDWRTQGDWVGRYGLTKGILCAMQSPLSQEIGTTPDYSIQSGIGPHFIGYDGIYSYIHQLKTNNPRVIFNPVAGVRRQAEWNDGTWQGAKYPATFDGPDLWVKVKVPAGSHRVALHFYNKDGHTTLNRYRDYVIELKKGGPNRDLVDAAVPLAQARVRDFWGSVYHSFAVQGPGDFTFKIARHGSYATILQAVFIDKWDAPPTYGDYRPPAPDETTGAAVNLWKAAEQLGDKTDGAVWQYSARLMAYRTLHGKAGSANLRANWRWQLPLWINDDTSNDHADFVKSMAHLHPPKE